MAPVGTGRSPTGQDYQALGIAPSRETHSIKAGHNAKPEPFIRQTRAIHSAVAWKRHWLLIEQCTIQISGDNWYTATIQLPISNASELSNKK